MQTISSSTSSSLSSSNGGIDCMINLAASTSPPQTPTSIHQQLLNSPTSIATAAAAATIQQSPIMYKRVRPEPVNERTLVGSVVEFIHDVVADKTPQTSSYNNNQRHLSINTLSNQLNFNSGGVGQEIKEPIEWLHYETIHINNKIKSTNNNNNNNNNTNSTHTARSIASYHVLVIGYKTGFQVWIIDVDGVATEALSIKETQITRVKLIKFDSNKLLLAICKHLCDSNYCVQIVSLLNGDFIHKIDYSSEIIDIKSNSKLLVVSTTTQIDAFDILNNYEHKFTINTCYVNSNNSNPFALGTRWLAFADNKFHVMFNSQGGMANAIEQSYTATVLNTAKSITKGIAKISESVVNTVVTKAKSVTNSGENISPRSSKKQYSDQKHDDCYQPGVCTIIDTQKYTNNKKEVHNLHDDNQNWLIAHFIAHQEAIYKLEFNQSGRLLVTVDQLGQQFNVFLINSNPFKCTRTIIRHLYVLYRGDTTSRVTDISFSFDSRWVAVSTKRGTTHLFPINSYGGIVNSRTHSHPYVVNRASKHSRTAGFVDDETNGTFNIKAQSTHHHNTSLLQTTQPSSQGGQPLPHNTIESTNNPLTYINNPKIKNLLEPFVIHALGQIRQPNINDNVTNSIANTANFIQMDNICVAAMFGESRGYLSPEEPRDFTKNRLRAINSIFVISNVNGNLIEYVLDVVVDTSKTNNKKTNDSPIQLKITPKAQWPLQRSIAINEMKLQLQNENPLLLLHKKFNDCESSPQQQPQQQPPQSQTQTFNDWIKTVEITTHLGPHRRLFMGPQFIFKTLNTNSTMTALNPSSSSIVSNETPLIDLSGDIELNSLDLTKNYSSSPMQIPAYFNRNGYSCTPTFIEVGPGSYQDEMPICNIYSTSHDSQKSNDLLSGAGGGSGIGGGGGGGGGESIVDSLADAMNDLNTNDSASNSLNNIPHAVLTSPYNNTNNKGSKMTAAIAIAGGGKSSIHRRSSHREHTSSHANHGLSSNGNSGAHTQVTHIATTPIAHHLITTNTINQHHNNTNSTNNGVGGVGGGSGSGVGANGKLINVNMLNANNHGSSVNSNAGFYIIHGGGGSSSSGGSNCINDVDIDSNSSSTYSSLNSRANAPSLENIQFQDDNLIQ